MKKKIMATLLAMMTLLACSSATDEQTVTPSVVPENGSLQAYTSRLAEQLFQQVQSKEDINHDRIDIAVASFLPSTQFDLATATLEEKQLANQLSENMLAHASALGFKVYDYRVREKILLKADHEQAFSRQLDDLSPDVSFNAILSGTYTMTEDKVLINARLTDIVSKRVLAAATTDIPATIFWSEQQVTKRGDKLHRQQAGVLK